MKGVLYLAAAGGFVWWARRSSVFTQFRHVRDIPDTYVRRQLRLRGTVMSVLDDGTLRVAHEPLIPVEKWLRTKPEASPGCMNVRIGAVNVSDPGRRWLDNELVGDRVWFQLIRRVPDGAVDANITAKRPGAKRPVLYNLNRELVERGYARAIDTSTIDHKRAIQTIPAYSRLVTQLQIAQRGTTEITSETQESVMSLPVQTRQVVQNSSIYQIAILAGWGTYATVRVLIQTLQALIGAARSGGNLKQAFSSQSASSTPTPGKSLDPQQRVMQAIQVMAWLAREIFEILKKTAQMSGRALKGASEQMKKIKRS